MGVAAERAPRVLFASPELAPWVKVGGLGEVARDLPIALAHAGADVRLLVPAFPALKSAFPAAAPIAQLPAPGGALPASALLAARGAIPLYLLDCESLYARSGGPYQDPEGADWHDNHLRYGLLSRVAALLASDSSPLDWQPDVLHTNDWQTGLAPAYLAHAHAKRAPCVHTIHNLAYQGLFPPGILHELALPAAAFSIDGLEFHGQVSFLKAAIRYASAITTVSPTYAREIQTAEFGSGLDGLLRARRSELTGILNGIDYDAWDPQRDPHLPQPYGSDSLERKRASKNALQRALGLHEDARIPVFGMVSRLVEQKGIDLVLEAADSIVQLPAQLAVLGVGGPQIVAELQRAAQRHPGAIAVRTGFDEPLAHLVEAGADLYLMPSRFEPCGLNQLYSMRYGTPPVVRRTGGLADSVVDCSEKTLADGTATGFAFDAATASALLDAMRRAIRVLGEPEAWRSLQRNGMARDFRWQASAARYLEVYAAALSRRPISSTA